MQLPVEYLRIERTRKTGGERMVSAESKKKLRGKKVRPLLEEAENKM